MSESRPHLTPSQSFAGSSVSAISRPLKRRLTETPDLDFFTPAAQSFKPRPYTPNGTSAPVKPPPATRSHSSSTNVVQAVQVMDPSPTDPHAVFLHPPFTTFPDSYLHPEGISYALMAMNPEWFLDATDFISTNPNTDGQDVISYPPQLEPPRGWCPAKKKDLKALGAEGWPEGEEPRLRCTFCRRTYAGVNAKSMWRRHVYEKHKIAMANRREGSDRVRGRTSNKENRHAYSRNDSDDGGRKTMKLEPTSPQENYDPLSRASSSRFRSLAPPIGDDFGLLSAPYIEQNEFPMPTISVNFSEAQLAISPPLTPQSLSPEIANRSFSEPTSPSPKHHEAVIPASPYNPLLTPSFRHSPPRLPSDQPWRFPSPSHPLHSKTRELYLGAVVRGATSPSVSILDSSPVSMLNTPAIHHKARYNTVDSDNADRLDSSPIATRPSPRSLYGPSQSPFPSSTSKAHVDESPLSRLMRRKNNNRQKSALSAFSEVGNDWFSDGALPSSSGLVGDDSANGLLTPIRVVGDDPFARLYHSWVKEPQSAKGKEGRVAPLTNPCEESPVLRSSQLREGRLGTNESDVIGLGIGLMAPFTFASEEFRSHEDLSDNEKGDLDLNYPPSPEDERDMAEVHSTLTSSGPPGLQNLGLRRTHTFMSGFDIQDENEPYEPLAPPLKRRRTVPMHG